MYGPTSLRRNDLTLLRFSSINDRAIGYIIRLWNPFCKRLQYIIFGGSAYHKQTHISSYLKAIENIPGFADWNKKLKKVRISIEWYYGTTAGLLSIFSIMTN